MKFKTITYYILIINLCIISACKHTNNDEGKTYDLTKSKSTIETIKIPIIVDCNYSFDEAIAGSKAPQEIIDQLTIIEVKYYSFDNILHQGQIVCNKAIENDLIEIFDYIQRIRFPVEKAIPIVRYNHNDLQSMNDNNTYCFCYRNQTYSKHATGMAIDINPMQNPLRWKKGYQNRKNLPENAEYNYKVPGTLHPQHSVVLKFEEMGFKWGHYFRRNFDDHHFEKQR